MPPDLNVIVRRAGNGREYLVVAENEGDDVAIGAHVETESLVTIGEPASVDIPGDGAEAEFTVAIALGTPHHVSYFDDLGNEYHADIVVPRTPEKRSFGQ